MKIFQNTILVIALLLMIWFTIDILNQTTWWGNHIDFETGSKYGTLIGGLFSFLGVILIFLTLKHQTTSYERSSFENRFFQMIDYHRNNIELWEYKNPNSKNIEIIKGHKIFINISREITKAIKILKYEVQVESIDDILSEFEIHNLNENRIISSRKIDILELETINLAYLIVFFGLSKEGRPILERILSQRCKVPKIKKILDYFEKIPAKWDKSKCKSQKNRIKDNKHYKYFGGHQHRLGHYYRHIYQTINYCNDYKPFYGKYNFKYNYIKTFRAQFSTYEQAVFTYNSLSIMGRVWEFNQNETEINNQLITKYNFIKNIPAEFISEFEFTIYYPDIEYEGQTEKSKRKKKMIKKYK